MNATDKQIWFIKKLGAERGMSVVDILDAWDGNRTYSLSALTVRDASDLIDMLKKMAVAA